MTDNRRSLPAIHALLDDPALAPLLARAPRERVAAAVRATVTAARSGAIKTPASADEWAAGVEERLAQAELPSLQRVVNATGIVLHTNLGRAPLAAAALSAINTVAAGYANVEYDLDRGTRGSRLTHARALLCELTGAEDALVVNNCAAALVLSLRALAGSRDVLVSRGELIEIGGSFRVPDIMAEGGVRLVEVGTTNRTHVDDYRRAISATTGAIVKVHRSNFTMEGFVADVSGRELAAVANEAGVPLVFDFGSGLLLDLAPWGLTGEPTVVSAVASGASVITMSGDKLMGGPQAGIILGRHDLIATLRAHPLARAMRVDKLTLAALEATLALYRDPRQAVQEIPALAMITETPDSIRARATSAQQQLANRGVAVAVVATEGAVGGGAFPTARLASWALRVDGDPVRLEQSLRGATRPVVGRITNDALLLDLRTVLATDESALIDATARALAEGSR